MTPSALFVHAVLFASLGAGSTFQLPGQAFSQPVSRDRVVLHLQTADGDEATVTVLNGAMARVEQVDGERIGLVPVIREATLSVAVVSISRDPMTGAEGVRQLGMLTATEGRPTTTTLGAFPVTLTWTDTQPPAAQGEPTSAGPCSVCCVACAAHVFCGCRVTTDCGTCCCPTACECPDTNGARVRTVRTGAPSLNR
jgi:hypothetical protein